MQVEGQHWYLYQMATGARVRNAYATCLIQRDSPWKRGLISHGITISHVIVIKVSTVQDGHAYD